MCRLFAYIGDFRDLSPYLTTGERALVRPAPEHPNGWGIARWSGGGPAVRKAGKAAHEDPLFDEIARWTRSTAVLAHLRRGEGDVAASDANAHPYAFGPFAFAHEGTLRGLDAQARDKLLAELPEDLREAARGNTDSEVAFLLTVHEVRARHHTLHVPIELAAEAMRSVQARLLKAFPGDGDAPSEANFILGNGRGFAATRHGLPLSTAEGEGFACLASEPLGPEDVAWREVPEGALLLVQPDGRVEVLA